MYAIVKCGGRQYRAEEGDSFVVEKLPYEVGEQIEIDDVLLVSDGVSTSVGQPVINGALEIPTAQTLPKTPGTSPILHASAGR